jgi:hypothetical protein
MTATLAANVARAWQRGYEARQRGQTMATSPWWSLGHGRTRPGRSTKAVAAAWLKGWIAADAELQQQSGSMATSEEPAPARVSYMSQEAS